MTVRTLEIETGKENSVRTSSDNTGKRAWRLITLFAIGQAVPAVVAGCYTARELRSVVKFRGAAAAYTHRHGQRMSRAA